MKRICLFAGIVLCLFSAAVTASAAVGSTKEPTAGNKIYIAGNPDLYPLEYYDEKSGTYQGIMPEIFEEIGEKNGLEFSYIASDGKNRQEELAENAQVEIASVHDRGDIELEERIRLFTYTESGEQRIISMGFTKIASPELISTVKNAMEEIDQNVWIDAIMALEKPKNTFWLVFWLILALILLAFAVAAILFYMHKKSKEKAAGDLKKMTDPLTGIGNTAYFENCYAHHVSEELRPLFYLAYISTDIEKIETYFGAPQAEELQRYAAGTLNATSGDNDFAARIGDGVFALCFMCPDLQRASEKMTELMRNLNSYSESIATEQAVLFRCGLLPPSKERVPVEDALFKARQGYLSAVGQNDFVCLCDKKVMDRVSLKSRLQKKISTALENGEFQIYLQFIYDVKNKCLCGAEALSRWHSPEDGVLSPSNYIDDMKIAGMIDRLDLYIFEKTCAILDEWSQTDLQNLRLSCNFTRKTLSLPGFAEQFKKTLEKYKFERSKLIVEITEDALSTDGATTYKNILAIKQCGCLIALDDFGSGYTSFRDLCDYPLDVIKIDRQITRKAAGSRGNAVLVGITRMAHALGIRVLCEGVESDQERDTVSAASCDYIQGYFYSRVFPLENALEFFNKHKA